MTEALVQNRLTVLAANLSLLVFVTIGIIALGNGQGQTPDLVWIYLNSFVPISTGFLLSVAGIGAFLHSQRNASAAWFSAGQVMLYLALAQFLASGMNNFVYGFRDSLKQHPHEASAAAFWAIIILLVFASEVLWIWLLIVAPVGHLRDWRSDGASPQATWQLKTLYGTLLGIVLVLNSLPYYIKHGDGAYWKLFVAIPLQLAQPFLWLWPDT